jgi:NhaP-type Na+/H+ and K+/H+ antiporter
VVTLSILVTRIAAVALRHTGLARQTARFQARSAFSGAGFTTSESELVVNHPVRRRIVLALMLLGNAGIVTAVSSLILAFVTDSSGDAQGLFYKILLLVGGLVVLWAISLSPWADRVLSRLVDRALKRFTRLDVQDYEGLLHLAGDYRIMEMAVEPGTWLEGRALSDLRPADEGVLVLGIVTRDGDWLGTPAGDTRPRAGDTLVVYGRTRAIRELTERHAGDERGHREAVATQDRVAAGERRRATGETGRAG